MHDTTATLTLILVPIHAALRWRWIVGVARPFRRLAPEAVTVKFLRHLSAVVLAVAVIAGLGMLWAHASGSGTTIGSGVGPAPSREALLRLEHLKADVIGLHSGNGFQFADTRNLIRTCVIETVLAGAVITVSAIRWRHRRMRRTAIVRT